MKIIELCPLTSLPIQEDPSPTANNHVVIFKHPGYPDEYEQNILLRLYAWDSPNGGLHAGTALLACTIIACNAYGYLTIERDGPKLELQDDNILTAQKYYFHVPRPLTTPNCLDSDDNYYRYPIYPSFQHWAFPHRNVPSQWRGFDRNDSDTTLGGIVNTPSVSSASAAVINRDKSCVISKNRDYIERAHLCPRNELDWFRKNGMRQYNARLDISGDVITDDVANALAMRADIHRAFDDCKFVLVPKCGRWTIHFLEKTYDLGRIYHNRPIEIAGGVSPEFILTRFAWALFPLVKAFMEQGPERAVKVREQSDNGLYETVKTLDPAGFERMTAATRGRSSSPRKRKATDTLPPISEMKCFRKYFEHPEMQASTVALDCYLGEERTPSLSSNDGTSVQPHVTSTLLPNCPEPSQGQDFNTEDSEFERLSALRRRALRKGRPQDSTLLCCDYSLAEQANALGIPGKPEYGGGHLCSQCLGLESAHC
jgi:hypothetical protein